MNHTPENAPEKHWKSRVILTIWKRYTTALMMAVVIYLLKRFTSLPFWACVIVGIPSFSVVFFA